VIITEELGKNPQEEMIGKKKRELRHRIKQTPFKKLIRAVEDKAAEVGSVVFYVSSFKNSKVCPMHFVLLKNGGGWHDLHCPRGHVVDRDAAVLNMLWKITPEGATKALWWDVKEVRKRLKRGIVPREAVGKANPIIPRPIIHAVLASLGALKAGDKWPAVLARAAPTTPAQGADKGGTRALVNRPSGRGGGHSMTAPYTASMPSSWARCSASLSILTATMMSLAAFLPSIFSTIPAFS
jgi:IS605 OrfB family transposase